MKQILLIMLSISILAACTPKKDKIIPFNDQYIITIPNYLTVNKELNRDSVLAYENIYKEIYLTVKYTTKNIFEFKDTADLETAAEFFLFALYFAENEEYKIDRTEENKFIDLKINGLHAKQTELICINKNEKINIIMTVIESEKYFYKIGTITYLHDKDKYSEDLTKMINSFKEINPKN